MLKRLKCLYLDILSIPGFFMSKETNAKFHLKYVCPKCPDFRKKMRDVSGTGKCWWLENWNRKNYNIPRNYGYRNFVSQYLFLKTNLTEFKDKNLRKI